jgi:hypothetical protein
VVSVFLSCIFYVHVEYIRLYGPMKILFLFVYALITFYIRHSNFIVMGIGTAHFL